MASEGDTIIFIARNLFYVYDANNIFKLEVPQTVIRDLDIIDKTSLDGLVDKFVKDKKLGTGGLWIILSDEVCFSKDIGQADAAKLESEIRDFLETVPFDQIISKRFKSQAGVRVIAANLEVVEAVVEIFDRNGFVTGAVTPAVIFPGYSTKKALDPDFARFILVNKNLARQGNMLAKASLPVSTSEVPREPDKKKNRLLPYLLVGFGVLLVILVATILLRG